MSDSTEPRMEWMGTEAFAMVPYAGLLPNLAKPELPIFR